MDYAIIQTSGKQFLVKLDQWYDHDFILLPKIGSFIALNKILLFKKENKIQLGQPFLNNIQILAKIIQTVKAKKITVLKTKPKKKYTRTKGHKTLLSRIQINKF